MSDAAKAGPSVEVLEARLAEARWWEHLVVHGWYGVNCPECERFPAGLKETEQKSGAMTPDEQKARDTAEGIVNELNLEYARTDGKVNREWQIAFIWPFLVHPARDLALVKATLAAALDAAGRQPYYDAIATLRAIRAIDPQSILDAVDSQTTKT